MLLTNFNIDNAYAYKVTDSILDAINCEILPLDGAATGYSEADEISHQVFFNNVLAGYIYADHGVFYPGCPAPGNYNTPEEAAVELIPAHILEDIKISIAQHQATTYDYF